MVAGLNANLPPINGNWQVNPAWGKWTISGDEKGEEPPGEYKVVVERLYQIHLDFVAETDPQKRFELEQEAYQIHTDNLLMLNVLSKPHDLQQTNYKVIHNRIKNHPTPVTWERHYSYPAAWSIQE